MRDILAELNAAQREAVTAGDGPWLVVAGAGSGKTRVLTTRVAWLLAERRALPAEIVAFTFTNRAAREMRERVDRLVGEAAAPRWIGTFHATGARLLRRDGAAIGVAPDFTIYDGDDSLRLVKQALQRVGADGSTFTPSPARAQISRWKNDGRSPAEAAESAADWREAKLAEAYAAYERALRANNALDFDDLILRAVELLEPGSAALARWAGRFRHVLVDEFQDTNRLQFVLVKALSHLHGNVFAVGDDDQSIYGWRGACLENMLEFEAHFPGARLIRLEQNYRSTGRILAAANAVIARNRRRRGKNLWTAGEEGDQLALAGVLDEEDEGARLVAIVREEVGRGLARGDVTVLYRTNAQSRALEDALRRADLPYQIVGSTQFYERREVRDLLAYLKLIANPRDEISALRILNVPRRKIGDATAARLVEAARAGGLTLAEAARSPGLLEAAASAAAARRVRAFFDQIDAWREAEAALAVPELLARIVAETGYREFLRQDEPETADQRLENVDELLNAAYAFAEASDGARLAAFLEQTALVADADALTTEGGVVRLMTIHTAKGLEFPVVVIAGCEEGLLPHAANLDDDDRLEEERRLFYVALTRARRRVHLLHARLRRRLGSRELSLPSRFLAEIPEGLLVFDGEGTAAVPGVVRAPFGLGAALGLGREGGRAVAWEPSGAAGAGAGRAAGRGADHRGDRPRAAALPATPPRPRAAPSGPEGAGFFPGQPVLHATFGRGVVARIEGEGDDLLVTVDFAGHGRKHLIARFAHLKPLA